MEKTKSTGLCFYPEDQIKIGKKILTHSKIEPASERNHQTTTSSTFSPKPRRRRNGKRKGAWKSFLVRWMQMNCKTLAKLIVFNKL